MAASAPAAAPLLVDPGVVPLLATRWSHAPGEIHGKVVPCSWRATTVELTVAFVDLEGFTTFTEAEADAKASQLLIGFQHDAEWSCASTAGA
jgi:class 3 adenylate cyclase